MAPKKDSKRQSADEVHTDTDHRVSDIDQIFETEVINKLSSVAYRHGKEEAKEASLRKSGNVIMEMTMMWFQGS